MHAYVRIVLASTGLYLMFVGQFAYSARMSPENTHKLMGFYMEVLILGIILQYMVSASLSCFLQGV